MPFFSARSSTLFLVLCTTTCASLNVPGGQSVVRLPRDIRRREARGYEVLPGTLPSTTSRDSTIVRPCFMLSSSSLLSLRKVMTITGGASNAATDSARMNGRFILLFVALLYGSLNVCIRQLFLLPGAPLNSALSTVRGFMAAAVFLPVLCRNRNGKKYAEDSPKRRARRSCRGGMVRAALELAVWNALTQTLINAGLLVSEAARASFLMQTSVVLTPILSTLLCRSVSVSVAEWLGCGAALAGVGILSFPAAGSAPLAPTSQALAQLSRGDFLCLSGAVCWSLYIIRLGELAGCFEGGLEEGGKADGPSSQQLATQMQGLKTCFLAVGYAAWACVVALRSSASTTAAGAVQGLWPGWRSPLAWGILLYSAVGPGAIADVLQSVGQSSVTPAEANVLLCAEPVFTALCSRVFLGELTSAREKVGGGLIMLAALVASSGDRINQLFFPLFSRSRQRYRQ